jgi:hypothetical protein
MDIVGTSDARPHGLWVFGVADIIEHEITKTEEKKYDNTNVIVLDNWLGVLLAALGMRIGRGPPVAGGRSPWFMYNKMIGCCIKSIVTWRLLIQLVYNNILGCCVDSIVT